MRNWSAFSIPDDGRDHPIEKTLEGTSYLRLIYTHFDYPFEAGQSASTQLQSIGMSLVNAICSEPSLAVPKPEETLIMSFKDEQVRDSAKAAAKHTTTGITVPARLRPKLTPGRAQPQGAA